MRRSKATPKKIDEFLNELAECGIVSHAAEICNLERVRLYELRSTDETFRQRWDEAVDRSVDKLEREARRRALEGWEEPVFHLGKKMDVTRKYSDTLLIFLMKGNRPEKYRERISSEIVSTVNANLQGSVTVYIPANGRDGSDTND